MAHSPLGDVGSNSHFPFLSPLRDQLQRWRVPLDSSQFPSVSGKRHNCSLMSPLSLDASLPGAEALLDISGDGRLITTIKYSAKESVGVSLLVATSCLSLVTVLSLLILMGVSIPFSTRLPIGCLKHVSLHRRLPLGQIGPLITRTTSSEPMSLHISSVFWSPISFKARSIGRLLCWAAADTSLVALASIMNARWVQSGGVESGRFCTAQGTNV